MFCNEGVSFLQRDCYHQRHSVINSHIHKKVDKKIGYANY